MGDKKLFLIKNSGFTLIELLVIISVLTVLATASVVLIKPATQLAKANDARRKQDLAQIQRALEIYYQNYGRYPLSDNGRIVNTLSNGTTQTIPWGQPWGSYMNVIPADPNSNKRYVYFTSTDGQKYGLYASLDNSQDPQKCSTLDTQGECISKGTFPLCSGTYCVCGPACNFGVTSSNITP